MRVDDSGWREGGEGGEVRSIRGSEEIFIGDLTI